MGSGLSGIRMQASRVKAALRHSVIALQGLNADFTRRLYVLLQLPTFKQLRMTAAKFNYCGSAGDRHTHSTLHPYMMVNGRFMNRISILLLVFY